MRRNSKESKSSTVMTCQKMLSLPFFTCTADASNDCYVSWYVGSIEEEDHDDYEDKVLEQYRKVDKWLTEHGAKDKEKVIVEHSW